MRSFLLLLMSVFLLGSCGKEKGIVPDSEYFIKLKAGGKTRVYSGVTLASYNLGRNESEANFAYDFTLVAHKDANGRNDEVLVIKLFSESATFEKRSYQGSTPVPPLNVMGEALLQWLDDKGDTYLAGISKTTIETIYQEKGYRPDLTVTISHLSATEVAGTFKGTAAFMDPEDEQDLFAPMPVEGEFRLPIVPAGNAVAYLPDLKQKDKESESVDQGEYHFSFTHGGRTIQFPMDDTDATLVKSSNYLSVYSSHEEQGTAYGVILTLADVGSWETGRAPLQRAHYISLNADRSVSGQRHALIDITFAMYDVNTGNHIEKSISAKPGENGGYDIVEIVLTHITDENVSGTFTGEFKSAVENYTSKRIVIKESFSGSFHLPLTLK
jgi:hypothetical protein